MRVNRGVGSVRRTPESTQNKQVTSCCVLAIGLHSSWKEEKKWMPRAEVGPKKLRNVGYEPKGSPKHPIAVREEVNIMKLPEYAASGSDRASTREELFEVLEVLGGFGQPHETDLDQTGDLLSCLETDHAASPIEILEEVCSDERLLMEIEPFNSLLSSRKAERIN